MTDFRRNVVSLQCDARRLQLPDESVDLIITSPPYWSLRSYQDGGEHYEGQIGSEPTWQEYLEHMWECTREWVRVLKSDGNLFINIGDVYGGGGGGPQTIKGELEAGVGVCPRNTGRGIPAKSLGNIPARYAIGCTDQLGLIQRAEIVWAKPNGVPESVKDRVRRDHEVVYHFTRNERYYSAVDRIREPQNDPSGVTWDERKALGEPQRYGDTGIGTGAMTGHLAGNPLGKLPSSVWTISTFPLNVPKLFAEQSIDPEAEDWDYDHFAAFPPKLVQRIILAWSPSHVCRVCGQGRFPVTSKGASEQGKARIIGYACACTPFTDHPENRGKDWRGSDSGERKVTGQRMGKDFQKPAFEGNGHPSRSGGEWAADGGASRDQWGRGMVREYHLDTWQRPASQPGVVLDPFGGTGTTAIVAAILGRRGISCDLSYDYACRLVPWRMNDRAQMRALLGTGAGR